MTTPQAAAAAGITYRQLDYWTRVGAARPHVDARGSGSQRVWTAAEEAEVLERMATWRGLGVELALAREMAERGARIVYDDAPLLATVA